MNRYATLALCGLTLAASGAFAHGDVTCPTSPKEEWQPQMALQKKLTDQGWRVRQVKLFKNCYEVYGLDEKGGKVEAFFDPKTFDRVEPK